MLIVFLSDLTILPNIVHRLLRLSPESFESYDDHTFRLAVRFLPQILGQMGLLESIRLGFAFLPEVWMALTGGVLAAADQGPLAFAAIGDSHQVAGGLSPVDAQSLARRLMRVLGHQSLDGDAPQPQPRRVGAAS